MKLYPMDLANMKKLYDAIDVIGVSGECWITPLHGWVGLHGLVRMHGGNLRHRGQQ